MLPPASTYRWPLKRPMPVPPLVPTRLMMSALPSWLVSRSATNDVAGGGGGAFLSADGPLGSTATYTSPLDATTTWRPCRMLSANIVAQKPEGSVMPALSPGQLGAAVAAAVAALSLTGAFSDLEHPARMREPTAARIPFRTCVCIGISGGEDLRTCGNKRTCC